MRPFPPTTLGRPPFGAARAGAQTCLFSHHSTLCNLDSAVHPSGRSPPSSPALILTLPTHTSMFVWVEEGGPRVGALAERRGPPSSGQDQSQAEAASGQKDVRLGVRPIAEHPTEHDACCTSTAQWLRRSTSKARAAARICGANSSAARWIIASTPCPGIEMRSSIDGAVNHSGGRLRRRASTSRRTRVTGNSPRSVRLSSWRPSPSAAPSPSSSSCDSPRNMRPAAMRRLLSSSVRRKASKSRHTRGSLSH
jgi:hypothetical protein